MSDHDCLDVLTPREKESLIREAAELAAELITTPIPRLDPASHSPGQTGFKRGTLETFLGYLRQAPDLASFRLFLKAAPALDRATAQNQHEVMAHLTTLAALLAAALDEHPDRPLTTWRWILGWTARLLVAEQAERRRPRPPKGGQGGSPGSPSNPGASPGRGAADSPSGAAGFNQLGAQLASLRRDRNS